jgi:DNA polymerase-3 subunit gamma/tau
MAGSHSENVALAIRETLGLAVSVVAIHGPEFVAREVATSVAEVAGPEPSDGNAPVPSEEGPQSADPPAPDTDLSGPEVIARMLGGTVIED